MKILLPALFCLLVISSCLNRKRVEPELPIPAATTPFSCDSSFYFTRLFDGLKGENVWNTPSGDLLMSYGNKTNLVSRVDTNGNIIWQKTMGKWNGSYFRFTQKAGGLYYAQYSDDKDLVFAHVDDELNILKQVRTRWQGACSLYNTIDGGKMIVKNPSYHGGQVTYVIKYIDKNLDEQWEYTEGDGMGTISNFFTEQDGYYYFSGGHITDGKEEPYLLKMNRSGQVIWARQYSGFDSQYDPEDIHYLAFADGTIHARVSARKPSENPKNMYILRLYIDPENGNLLKHEPDFTDAEWPKDPPAKFPSNNGYFMLTRASSEITGKDVVIQSYNTNDVLLWEKTYPASGDQAPYGITQMPDGTIYLFGEVYYYDGANPYPLSKKMLAKLDSNGNTCY